MSGAHDLNIGSDIDFTNAAAETSGFQNRPARTASMTLTNAAAASLAVATLSLCLVVALAALSIRVVAATPIAG